MDQPVSLPAQDPPREVELKLALDPDAAASVEAALARLATGRPKRRKLSSTYFDTRRFALRRAGVTLRVRRIGTRRVQTVKQGGGAGLFDRPEWEAEIAGEGPDWDMARATGLKPFLKEGLAAKARPAFAVEVLRTTFDVRFGASRIEAALDRGGIEADGRAAPVCELELELRQGRVADLFGLAEKIAGETPLRLGLRTKAEQGYRLAGNEPTRPEKAEPPKIAAGMSVREAFRTIARSCIAHLLANAPLLPAGRDPEAVHQMRVAMRRLRAALSIFRDAVADERVEEVKAGLRGLADDLGEARDLDVFIEKTLGPARAERPDDAALKDLAASYAGRREAAYDKAVEVVASGRLDRIALATLAWVEAGPWLAREEGAALREAPVEGFAARELARRAKRVRRKAGRLEELDPEARHRVRIAVKKLRYAAEFFAPLFRGKGRSRRAKALRAALGDLQDRLGDLNDIAVGAGMAAGSGNGADPAARQGAELLAADQASRFDEHLGAARRAYRDFAGADPFWR